MNEKVKYFAVTERKTGKIIGYINLETNDTIQDSSCLIVVGYGKPNIISKDGTDYLECKKDVEIHALLSEE